MMGPEGFLIYVDPATFPTKHMIVVPLTHLRNYKTDQVQPATDRPFRSVTIQAEYDCHLEKERVQTATYYAGAMATGEVVGTDPGGAQWQPIEAGSVSATVWKTACR